MINNVGWLKKLRGATQFPLGKTTDKLGKKNRRLCKVLLQGIFLRDSHFPSFSGAQKSRGLWKTDESCMLLINSGLQ